MENKIDYKIYDSHIVAQGMQFQIDAYYQPKKISMKRRIDIVLKELDPRPGEKILDIGTGVGTIAFHAAKRDANCFGVDYSYESIKMAIKLVEKFGLSRSAHFLTGNAFNLPFSDCSFDKVVASDFIEHITFEEKDKFLKEMHRVLKPKGTGVIFTPNGIREKIGRAYWIFRHFLFRDEIPTTDLHFGLTGKSRGLRGVWRVGCSVSSADFFSSAAGGNCNFALRCVSSVLVGAPC